MDNPVEVLRSRWLSGRGTRFLYFAIVLTIVGVLMMGSKPPTASGPAADVPVEQAVGLAVEVSTLCGDIQFRMEHSKACAQAKGILDGEKSSGGGVGVELAVGVPR